MRQVAIVRTLRHHLGVENREAVKMADVRFMISLTTTCVNELALPRAWNAGDVSPTKGDLARVTRAAAPVLLAHVRYIATPTKWKG